MLSAGKGNSPKRFKFPVAIELRSQLNDQLRALDGRVDNQTAILSELQDWYRRRAELHQEYAGKLDKLTKSLQARSKEQKLKRDQWSLFSVVNCHQVLVNQTRKDARDQYAMADVYLNNIVPRFTEVQDDVQRIFKKCRDIGYESHEELLKVLHELHTTMRTYHTYQADFKNAEGKLQNFQAQKAKLEKSMPKEKLEKSKKFRAIGKEIQKRNIKYIDAKMKALKARNEYILSMDSANAAIHKYFVEDISDAIDCMDFGFHSSIARAILAQINGQECLKRTVQGGIDDLNKSINNLDSRHDKQRFLEFNNAAFMLPKKFEFQAHKEDEVNHILVTKNIQEEIEKRYALLSNRLTNLKTESEETWKTIETAEKTLMEMTNTRDYDIAHYFTDELRVETKEPESSVMKRKADRQETEAFYLAKFREYTLLSNLICRLEARFDPLRKALGNETKFTASPTPSRNPAKARRRRIGRTPLMGQPRLFGGSLEEYLEATGQEIPLIMKSCIRVINLYGLHHQGIFRVSGSQLEINNFRESFERMDDPLAEVVDASDINSVAGVFKLYLRELREPIFPTVYFEQFMEIAQLDSKQDFVSKVRDVVMSLPRPVFIVMRYLFSFLNHLSEFSDENMMDPYNLAICFGPTLVPIPEDKDQVQYQNLVNDLIKNIIIFSEDIFINDGGTVYEKYISTDSLDLEAEIGYAPADDLDSSEVDLCPSEDESEILEAIAQFDFKARSERELSFKKGDLVLLQNQVSSDWWRGTHRGRTGLIPDKYILLKIRDEDKEKTPDSSKRRSSCSSESQISTVITPLCPSHNGGSPGPMLKRRNLHSRSLHTYETESYDSESASSPTPSYNSSISSSLPSESTLLTGEASPLRALSTATLSQPKEEKMHRSTSFNQDSQSPNKCSVKPKLYESSPVLQKVAQGPEPSRRPVSHGAASSGSSLSSSGSDEHLPFGPASGRHSSGHVSGAPDLVMGLPVSSLSTSPKDSMSSSSSVKSYDDTISGSGSSPTSPELNAAGGGLTAAECFAKQDQSTLKKTHCVVGGGGKAGTFGGGAQSDAQTQTLLQEGGSAHLSTAAPIAVERAGPPSREIHIEVRAAAELAPPFIAKAPSTPRLAERYLQAVAQSGGDSAVAVTQRIKPQVLKKPSLPSVCHEPCRESP